MQVWRSPAVEEEQQKITRLRVLSERNKWFLVDILIGACFAIEWTLLPFFRLFCLPAYFEPLYSKIIFASLLISAVSAFCHFAKISQTLLLLNPAKNVQKHESPTSPDRSYTCSNVECGPNMFSPVVHGNQDFQCSWSLSKSGLLCDKKPIKSPMFSSFLSGISTDKLTANANTVYHDSTVHSHSGSHASTPSSLLDAYSLTGISSFSTPNSVSLLDIALSPIVRPTVSPSPTGLQNVVHPYSSFDSGMRATSWSLQLMSAGPPRVYQYQVSCTPPSGLIGSLLGDEKVSSSFRLPTDSSHSEIPPNRLPGKEAPLEKNTQEYWTEKNVSSSQLHQWTLSLRKWLHGTIVQRLVGEIDRINRQLSDTTGEKTIIGSTTLDTLQKICSDKYQCMPTLATLLSFLECTKDQGYLVNRLRELSRGGCLEEFRWDSGSRSSNWPWKEHLPNDSLILLHLFATYMDTRMPPHPKCLSGRVFTQLCVVRHPDKPDFKSRFNTQLYNVAVQPPHFKLVLNGNLYDCPPGPESLYHTILLLFHHYWVTDGKFRSISLGPTGLNVSWIFGEH